jgi:hypothetical protein
MGVMGGASPLGLGFLALGACSPEKGPAGEGAGADDSGGEASGDSGGAEAEDEPRPLPERTYTDEALVAELERGLALGVPSPRVLQHQYLEWMAWGDEVCPGDPLQISDSKVPKTGCTAESGYFFSGVASYVATEDGESTLTLMSGDFELRDLEGRAYVAGGVNRFIALPSVDSGGMDWRMEVVGSWRDGTAVGWLSGEGYSGALTAEGSYSTAGATARLDGVLSQGGVEYFFDQLTFDTAGCDSNPKGALSVRDPSGLWATITLDEACTGCGVIQWDGSESRSPVCVDLVEFGRDLLVLPTVTP